MYDLRPRLIYRVVLGGIDGVYVGVYDRIWREEMKLNTIVLIALAICIGIVISCSIAGYKIHWDIAMEHWEEAVLKEAQARTEPFFLEMEKLRRERRGY